MRTTPDFYKTKEGLVVAIWQNKKPPAKSKLIFGYDYKNQKWVFTGRAEVNYYYDKVFNHEGFKK